MPLNNFNIGKDVTYQVITPNGPLSISLKTGFEAKPQYNKIHSKGMDGVNRAMYVPDGWEGTMKVDRQNSLIDDYFASQEAAYYAGQNLLSGTITETIREVNGAVSQYRYTGVVLSFDEAGNKTGDAKIEQTIGFFASQRIKVA